MSSNPITVPQGILAAKALRVLEDHKISQLIIIDKDRNAVGMIHLHDLLKAGLA